MMMIMRKNSAWPIIATLDINEVGAGKVGSCLILNFHRHRGYKWQKYCEDRDPSMLMRETYKLQYPTPMTVHVVPSGA